MKYRLKVYCQTELTREVTGWMQTIMEEWKAHDKQLEICQSYDFELPEPLTEDKRKQLLEWRVEGIRAVELEEISDREAKHENQESPDQ